MALSCSTSSGKMSNKDLFHLGKVNQGLDLTVCILKWANISATKVLLLLVISILMNGIIKGEDVK